MPLTSRIVTAICWGFAATGLTPWALGQTYEAGPAPTADINHVTVESVPGPTSRTTVGIKEQIACSIANWVDTDRRTDGSGPIDVSDNYGTINWSATNGTCNPTMGPSTTYTAPESATDTTDTITMEADDSPLGNDAAISIPLAIVVKVPTGYDKTFDSDSPLGTAGPPSVNIGARTYWWPQVTPTTVSFKNVSFRTNAVAQTRQWPNGDNVTFGPSTNAWSVAPRNGDANVWTVLNDRSTGKFPKGKLVKAGTSENCLFIWSRPWEFQAGGNWHSFCDPVMKESYSGATQTAKVSFGSTYGGEQGPYKD